MLCGLPWRSVARPSHFKQIVVRIQWHWVALVRIRDIKKKKKKAHIERLQWKWAETKVMRKMFIDSFTACQYLARSFNKIRVLWKQKHHIHLSKRVTHIQLLFKKKKVKIRNEKVQWSIIRMPLKIEAIFEGSQSTPQFHWKNENITPIFQKESYFVDESIDASNWIFMKKKL